MTDQEARDERTRIEQSNEVAGIVFDQIKLAWPDLHPVLDLRYGIADSLWAAGYRKQPEPEWEYAHAANGYWNDDETEFVTEEYPEVSDDPKSALAKRVKPGDWEEIA